MQTRFKSLAENGWDVKIQDWPWNDPKQWYEYIDKAELESLAKAPWHLFHATIYSKNMPL